MSINFDHICPITNQLMINPKKLKPCGHIFEGVAIEYWTKIKNTCPLDGRQIVSIKPQNQLKAEIHQFIASHPDLFEGKTKEELQQEVEQAYEVNPQTVHNARADIELERGIQNEHQDRQFRLLTDRVDLGALLLVAFIMTSIASVLYFDTQ